jgi:hypothetical protein
LLERCVRDNITAAETATASSLDDLLERYLRTQPPSSSSGWGGMFTVDQLIGSDALWNASNSSNNDQTLSDFLIVSPGTGTWPDYTSL